jgi:hypothetical protein
MKQTIVSNELKKNGQLTHHEPLDLKMRTAMSSLDCRHLRRRHLAKDKRSTTRQSLDSFNEIQSIFKFKRLKQHNSVENRKFLKHFHSFFLHKCSPMACGLSYANFGNGETIFDGKCINSHPSICLTDSDTAPAARRRLNRLGRPHDWANI